MTGAAGNGRPWRILVALDASEESQKALEATARLAADLEAELVGLFVEESELIEAAALPMTRLILRHGQSQTALDPALMRRALKITSSRARSALAATAERWQVKWSFRVAQGALGDEMLSQVRSHDLLALGRPRRARQGARPAEVLRRVTAEAACSVLLLRQGENRARPRMAHGQVHCRFLVLGIYASPPALCRWKAGLTTTCNTQKSRRSSGRGEFNRHLAETETTRGRIRPRRRAGSMDAELLGRGSWQQSGVVVKRGFHRGKPGGEPEEWP